MADLKHVFAHVQDSSTGFELPGGREIVIWQPFEAVGLHFHVTKFMIVELVAAVAMLAIFIPIARSIATGRPVRGPLANMFEVMLLFIRDQVARPAIGRHDADRFLPFLWTAFFFILFMNLLGLVPGAGSPTASLAVTGVLAVVTFAVVVGTGIKKFGPVGYWLGQIPHLDVPLVLKIFLYPMFFVIEIFGLVVKHFVLAVRLFANMFGGHMVLAVILSFIAATAGTALWYVVTPASVLGSVALSMLELLVAFIQAYVFTFLAALFIGMSAHQH